MRLRPIGLGLMICVPLLAAAGAKRAGIASRAPDVRRASDTLEEVHLADIRWLDLHNDLHLAFFAPGGKMAIVHGRPFDRDYTGEYIVRFDLPPGYQIPAHWHPMAENALVLAGEYLLGNGTRFDRRNTVPYHAGDYGHTPACAPQFGIATTRTLLEVHGEAPFAFHDILSDKTVCQPH